MPENKVPTDYDIDPTRSSGDNANKQIAMPQTPEEKKQQTIGEWVDSIESSMDEELVFKALEKAVDYGWVPGKVDTFTYMKNIERMKTILQAHTTQRLSELKEQIRLPETETSKGKSHSKAFIKGRVSENKRILQLIDEINS